MKKLLATAAIAATVIGTAAVAQNFDNTQGFVTVNVDRLQFTIDTTQNAGFTNLEAGYTFLQYDMSAVTSADVAAILEYDRGADTVGLSGKYTLTYAPGVWTVYGAAAVGYVAPVGNMSNGSFVLTPEVGAAYVISESVDVWGDVGYTWDMTNSFARRGGEAELGMTFGVADNAAVSTSVVRTFDTGADETQARVGLHLWF